MESPYINNQKSHGVFVDVLFFCYILSTYISQPPIMSSKYNSFLLYFLIAFTIFKAISELKKFNIKSYTYWYVSFFVFSMTTFFYASDPGVVLEASYGLFVIMILTFVFTYYLNVSEDIRKIIVFFALAGLILAVLMFIMGLVNYEDRLGQVFFGNANSFATIITISELSLIWLFVYTDRKKIKVIYIMGSILLFYLLLLSGGRKFIIVCLIFAYTIVFLKFYKTQKKKLFLNTVIYIVVLATIYYLIFNYKLFYNIIGIRFEGLFNFYTGRGVIDASTIVRENMIDFGISAFKQQPIFGYGLDNFKVLYFLNGGYYHYAHNNYIELLVDFGLIGFTLYYGFFIYLIFNLLKIKSDSSGMRDFFLGLLFVLLINDYGTVSYNLIQIQILLALADSYIYTMKKHAISDLSP